MLNKVEVQVQVHVHARLHLGLISLHAASNRKNGGVGFAVEHPTGSVRMRSCDTFRFRDQRARPFNAEEVEQLEHSVERAIGKYQFRTSVSVELNGELATHVGMGSGTAIRLAVLEGLATLNGVALSPSELIAVSGRGGASGIGINTYFKGGAILDLGVPMDDRGFVPSSAGSHLALPLTMPAIPFPEWPLVLCVPRSIVAKTQQEELDFFRRTTPLASASSFHAAYVALFELYASVLASDYVSFCSGVEAMQRTAWKSAEWNEYGETIKTIKQKLLRVGVDCVGLSSLGPMLFCFGKIGTLQKVQEQAERIDCDVYLTRARNDGRRLLS